MGINVSSSNIELEQVKDQMMGFKQRLDRLTEEVHELKNICKDIALNMRCGINSSSNHIEESMPVEVNNIISVSENIENPKMMIRYLIFT
jgi:archaellum component FlaC